jgi:energy-coupling factor transport system permease protein
MSDARTLHPGAWWSWALGLAVAAAMTTNVIVLAMLVTAACLVVITCRGDAPWALAFHQYLLVAGLIVVIRVVLRVLMSHGDGVAVAIAAGLADGFQLGAMIVCVGAANSLADPKQLLASLPAALHEAGTAVVIALSVFPQLAESVQRVRRARTLRPDPGRVRGLRGIVVPVLEDAFDRSLTLAASMEARGFGRAGAATRLQRRTTGALLVCGLALTCIGMYATLDGTTPSWLAWSALGAGLTAAGIGIRIAGRRVHRTRHRPPRWTGRDTLVAASGIATATLVTLAARLDPAALHPAAALAIPPVTLLSLVSAITATIPALTLSPRARTAGA